MHGASLVFSVCCDDLEITRNRTSHEEFEVCDFPMPGGVETGGDGCGL